jgi:hypothetical protein
MVQAISLADFIHGPEHVSPRRGIKRTKNVTEVRRDGEKFLRKRWGVRTHTVARRCPVCGTKNFMRASDKVCMGCKMKGAE